MYAAKPAIITLLSAISFLATASPVDVSPAPRGALANVAVVNLYSGNTCGGAVESFTVTGGRVCHPVGSPKASIQVSENNVKKLYGMDGGATRWRTYALRRRDITEQFAKGPMDSTPVFVDVGDLTGNQCIAAS
ncbi:hypothetical protein NUW58_g120 [Xylaria curta]|uniref:Uncharacterized protein n=1 Tax=Xylaria curta TaxID=42375 RepID=A0ACC1PQD6_9PEZI|nr:hypothetical protein NUW58_g120 [Xylaria curta]